MGKIAPDQRDSESSSEWQCERSVTKCEILNLVQDDSGRRWSIRPVSLALQRGEKDTEINSAWQWARAQRDSGCGLSMLVGADSAWQAAFFSVVAVVWVLYECWTN